MVNISAILHEVTSFSFAKGALFLYAFIGSVTQQTFPEHILCVGTVYCCSKYTDDLYIILPLNERAE